MNTYEASPGARQSIAQARVDDHLREAGQRRLARELLQTQQPTPASSTAPAPRHHSPLWILVHFRHAFA